jgi:hypothetical protein
LARNSIPGNNYAVMIAWDLEFGQMP